MIGVLVCGSTFGAVHAEAVRQAEELNLIGVMGTGSLRTQMLAAHHGARLFTGVDEVTSLGEEPRIASVVLRSGVLGGQGVEVADALLQAGWSVLVEQPVRSDEIKRLAGVARRNSRAIRIGNLYMRLAAVAGFIRLATRLRSGTAIKAMHLQGATQTLLPVAALLRRSLGPGALRVDGLVHAGGFSTCIGSIADTAISVQIHNEYDQQNRDNGALSLVSAQLFTDSGTLCLPDAAGPLIWYPRLQMGSLGDDGLPQAGDPQNRGEVLISGAGQPLAEWIRQAWTAAIAQDMVACAIDAKAGITDRAHLAESLADAALWSQLAGVIGLPKMVSMSQDTWVSSGDLKAMLEV